ncbi:hypothetical protein SRABI112_05100 [Pseudomonas mediterranea]|nr:hypothetical protein SRABI112_05100 [Pseudomonas mediterranea]
MPRTWLPRVDNSNGVIISVARANSALRIMVYTSSPAISRSATKNFSAAATLPRAPPNTVPLAIAS